MRTRHPRPAATRSAFAGFRFPPDVIVLAVCWYLRFGLSYRDVQKLLAERGIEVDHVTIYRWVLRFTPLLTDAARPCRHVVGDRWHVDETYVKVAGRWHYVYRSIDQFGQVIDAFVSARRDATAAHRSSSGRSGRPRSHLDDLAVAEPEDGHLIDPLEATPGRRVAEPLSQVGGRAGEPADDLVALADQLDDLHVDVGEADPERDDPAPGRQASSGA